MATGNMFSTACGRVSYVFGLQGPNFPIDTACSSSLVAIDHACETLRTGEANIGLAGGVNLILAPDITIDFSKAGMLAEDGHCKTFDARADGYVRGEGCGIVVLKRLSDAKRDGDPIFAIIRSSGINQDGASSGLTVPNGEAQVALINHVLDKAKLKGEDIDYIEAHGTGTRLGDPIEVKGIGTTYGIRDASNPIKLGSVKTNIGHLEGAAGVSGLIKTVLALQHEVIPKQLHFTKLNPHIEINFPALIVTEEQPWKMGPRVRRAAVSSFGFSGTNSHIIIEESPKSEFASLEDNREYVLTLSAKTEQALEALLQSYLEFLKGTSFAFGNICYTSNLGRDHYRYRLAVIAKNKSEAIDKLLKREFIKGEVQHEIPYDFEGNSELESLVKAYVSGAIINWEQLYGAEKQQKVCLPSYPFQRQRFWADAAQATKAKIVSYEHPLLGEKHASPKGDIYFEGELDLSLNTYLKDHYVFSHLIYPGAAHLEMMVAACVNGLGMSDSHLANVNFEAPLEFFKGVNTKTMVLMSAQESGYELGVFSCKLDGSWQVHAKGNLLTDSYPDEFFDFEACKQRCRSEFSDRAFYERITKFGMNLGPHFQSLKHIYTGNSEAWAELKISAEAKRYIGHPALVDGAIQLLSIRPWEEEGRGLYLPIGCDHVQVYAPLGDHVFVYCKGGEITESSSTGDLTFCDVNGRVLLKLVGMRYRKTTVQAIEQMLSHESSVREFLYQTEWQEVSFPKDSISMPKGQWLVFSGGNEAKAVVEALKAKGNTCLECPIQQTKQEFIEILAKESFCGIVHASSTFEQAVVAAKSIKEAQVTGAKSFLHLCQAVVEVEKSKKVPIVLLTENCYTTNIANSPLLGLYKTVVNEHPELEISNIDLGTRWEVDAFEQALFS
ncbi:MAG: polyketide synthase dehydratase domain-containing protein, partial [Verrucomicrobia bacterium]|nr:polyketide synthase dehydratase domain-containing protein [Verrucomicrobiota bacterium]